MGNGVLLLQLSGSNQLMEIQLSNHGESASSFGPLSTFHINADSAAIVGDNCQENGGICSVQHTFKNKKPGDCSARYQFAFLLRTFAFS